LLIVDAVLPFYYSIILALIIRTEVVRRGGHRVQDDGVLSSITLKFHAAKRLVPS